MSARGVRHAPGRPSPRAPVTKGARRDPNHVLIAVDDSDASRRAVRYVAALFGRRKGVRVCLLHVLRPWPAEILESGGADNPVDEQAMEDARLRAGARWTEQAVREAERFVGPMRKLLVAARIPARAIAVHYQKSIPEETVEGYVRRLLRHDRYGTVVVGRHSLPWFSELFHRHLGEALVRHAAGFTVWVVE